MSLVDDMPLKGDLGDGIDSAATSRNTRWMVERFTLIAWWGSVLPPCPRLRLSCKAPTATSQRRIQKHFNQHTSIIQNTRRRMLGDMLGVATW